MPANIASTTFGTTPDQGAVAVDIYGSPPQKPTNTIADVLITDAKKSTGLIGSGSFVSKVLKEMGSTYSKTGSIGFKDAFEKVAQVSGISKGALQNVRGTAIDNILQTFGVYKSPLGNTIDGIVKAAGGDSLQKTVLGGSSAIKLVVNGLEANVKGLKDLANLQGLSDIVYAMTGNKEFLEMISTDETLMLFKGINDIAREFSIPGVMDQLISKYNDRDKKTLIIGSASDKNALYDLSYVELLGNNANSANILATNPNIIKDIVSSFKSTIEYPIATAELCNRLINALQKIDPHWDSYLFGNRFVRDLSVFKSCSPFTNSCFAAANLYAVERASASFYTTTDIPTLAKKTWPYAPFSA